MAGKLDLVINGGKVGMVNQYQALANIFKMVPTLKYWSYDALKIFYVESIKMVNEVFMSRKANKTSLQFSQMIKRVPKDRDGILAAIYNAILSDEQKGLLRGFGVSNTFGDNLKGNPEYQSILKGHNRLINTK